MPLESLAKDAQKNAQSALETYLPQLRQQQELIQSRFTEITSTVKDFRQSNPAQFDINLGLTSLSLLLSFSGSYLLNRINKHTAQLRERESDVRTSEQAIDSLAELIPSVLSRRPNRSSPDYNPARTILLGCCNLKYEIDNNPQLKPIFVKKIIQLIDSELKIQYSHEVAILGGKYGDINVLTFFQNAARQEQSPGISIYQWLIDLSQEYVDYTTSTKL